MSEKAACPKCDSYVSEVYYDGCHEWCGWNCRVVWHAYAEGPQGRMEFDSDLRIEPEQIAHMAAAVGTTEDDVHLSVTVNGSPPRSPSIWLDPNQEPPKPISARKRRENLKELRDHVVRNALANAGFDPDSSP